MLGLAEIESRVVPTLYVAPGFAAAHRDLASVFRLVDGPVSGRNRLRRIRAEHGWLARQTEGSRLVHHGGGTAPKRGTRPIVLTIHDLQYLAYPQYFSRTRRRYLRWAMPRSVERAAVIAVPSNFVRGTVVDAYAVDPERVVVVPHGVEPSLGEMATSDSVLRERFSLGDGPLVVLPAMTHPHKGHEFILKVMAAHWHDREIKLVLIGGEGRAEALVRRPIDELGLADRVVRTGRVSAADRDGLLRIASVMLFPSEYEGFGAPIVEAMALGIPVVCSDRTCLPEVAGDAAVVLPLEIDAWATALKEADQRRAELIAAGRDRAAMFTARRSAEALLDAYAQALG